MKHLGISHFECNSLHPWVFTWENYPTSSPRRFTIAHEKAPYKIYKQTLSYRIATKKSSSKNLVSSNWPGFILVETGIHMVFRRCQHNDVAYPFAIDHISPTWKKREISEFQHREISEFPHREISEFPHYLFQSFFWDQ